VSKHGFWLLLDERELFVPSHDFPWFRNASIGQILNVRRPSLIISTGPTSTSISRSSRLKTPAATLWSAGPIAEHTRGVAYEPVATMSGASKPQFEVPQPIICSPFDEPAAHWHLEEGTPPARRPGRRPSTYYYPGEKPHAADQSGAPTGTAIELPLVNLIPGRLTDWRAQGYPGATATTTELLQ
jgi:hypothetical protein